MQDCTDLETAIGYRFKDRAHLTLAITHSSFAHEKTASDDTRGTKSSSLGCNERLEFLGDAVIGLVITCYLYQTFPNLSEGRLSMMKSRLVSGGLLGKAAKRLNLGQFLLLGRGEEKLGGRLRKSMLARTFEAIVGGIFLDGGLDSAQECILRFLDQELLDIHGGMERYDYKSQLQKVTQSLFNAIPSYELVSQTGPDHGRVFRVRARVKEIFFAIARGPSKKVAEQRAARLVLRKVEKQFTKEGPTQNPSTI